MNTASDEITYRVTGLANVSDHAYSVGAQAWFGLEARLRHGILTVSVTDRRRGKRVPHRHGTTVTMVWLVHRDGTHGTL